MFKLLLVCFIAAAALVVACLAARAAYGVLKAKLDADLVADRHPKNLAHL